MIVAPDEITFATAHLASGEAHIDVHELATGRRRASWLAAKRDILQMLFSPDGKSLFGVLLDGTGLDRDDIVGQCWSTAIGTPLRRRLARTDAVFYVPSGDRLLTKTDNRALMRDTDTFRVRARAFRLKARSHPNTFSPPIPMAARC